MAHPGLLSWSNSIRLTMANDSGRQDFKDQVQTYGFLFLDDYLDNIIYGAKQDPLIELVKTPGRKKAIAKKPKLVSSKLGNTVSLTSENESGTENLAPLSAALFKVHSEQAAGENAAAEIGLSKDNQPGPGNKYLRSPLLPIQPGNDTLSGKPQQEVLTVATPVQVLPVPHSSMEHSDLSVIAEDDEPLERGRPSTYDHTKNVSRSTPPASAVASQLHHRSPEAGLNISNHDINISSTESMDTFHSVPLDSSFVSVIDKTQTKETQPISVHEPQAPITHEADFRHGGGQHSYEAVEDFAMADIQEGFVPFDQKSIEKPSVVSFPTLPEPMPLRKSMRHPRDPAMITAMLGAATPGLPAGGKRTSWLIKAREVKALEVTTKKPFAQPVGSPPHGTKRKSEDFPAIPQFEAVDGERQPKALKVAEGETAPRKSKVPREPAQEELLATRDPQMQHVHGTVEPGQEGVLDRLKKTVEGLGARVNKTMGKSLGGGAATALAEARAAAEARVAERDRKEEEMTMAVEAPYAKDPRSASSQGADTAKSSTLQNEGRLSISDLFPMEGRVKEKHKVPEKGLQYPHNVQSKAPLDRESTSTTPPNSPPSVNPVLLANPLVFNKPHPVFIPPQPAASNSRTPALAQFSAFKAPSAPKCTTPVSLAVGFSPRLPSKSSPKAKVTASLTTHSTLESVQSDQLFEHDDDAPAWMHGTQDTEYTIGYETQSQPQNPQICDEDDSWSVDEKLAPGVQWTFSGSKEDSMTWSTLPSQSQRADTGPVIKTSPIREIRGERDSISTSHQVPGAFDVKMLEEPEEEAALPHDAELEEIILEGNAEPKIPRSQSQMSMASSESSQSQVGFLGQASKLLSSALGTSKKKQPEVKKVLQMAAAAAKKQQEEADKTAARLREMESRRQLALQRKAEEEKAKALEEDRKMKEEAERRKKEREEHTDKKPLKSSVVKKDDEAQKKRKIENEKKQEIKKPSVLLGKSHLKTALKQPTALNSSYAFAHVGQAAGSTSDQSKLGPESSTSLYKGKAQAQQLPLDDDVSQPSQLVQSQMAARAKAQLNASKQIEPIIPSESIELPDINSEYSDSDDEDRVRTFDPPEWAQSPELRQALEMQSTINPDDIFGAVRPLRMEEIFKTRTSRFRARTSSANWTGTDRLTIQEEKDYARRMGFK
ncbi:hypothetical protein M413DRAFT_225123 [Hebeloma cylindrosporum]|uniref:Inner centromere protein ARK-binding domain-containing protein n=1 Tax=Hebeloma cylindrosporum TaxID=76867 RepID=A0A0C2YEL3_HEBCY|nr:hypothetical protein M413DRAFT_225123 [Hebeloma cylindrosporum h7]